MAGLQVADLEKRNNWNLFLLKVLGSLPFETIDGKTTVVGHPDKRSHSLFVKELKNLTPSSLKTQMFSNKGSVTFPTTTGTILLTKLQKTKEFGSAGNTTAKEDKALSDLRAAISEEKTKSGLIELPFKVGSRKFMVYDAIQTPGTPKSDFHFVDKLGNEVFWMSHKDGKSEKDFQQWGGISEKEVPVNKHPETQIFIEKCQALFGSRIPNATTAAMEIKDPKLQNMSVYGIDYGKAPGRQNVDICLQGVVSLKKIGGFYTVTASAHVTLNGDIPHDGYEPVFMVIYKGDRSQFGVGGARFSISPRNCRKITRPWIT